jgi:hypothetical protein
MGVRSKVLLQRVDLHRVTMIGLKEVRIERVERRVVTVVDVIEHLVAVMATEDPQKVEMEVEEKVDVV